MPPSAGNGAVPPQALRHVAHAPRMLDEVVFRSTITTARRELDRGPYETDPPWTRTVSPSESTVFGAIGKEELGALAQAVRLWASRVRRHCLLSPRPGQ